MSLPPAVAAEIGMQGARAAVADERDVGGRVRVDGRREMSVFHQLAAGKSGPVLRSAAPCTGTAPGQAGTAACAAGAKPASRTASIAGTAAMASMAGAAGVANAARSMEATRTTDAATVALRRTDAQLEMR